MPKKVQTIIKVIECPNPRCPSRTLNPLGFQIVFKKFQNQYVVLCPHCGNPIRHSKKWDFEFTDSLDYKRKKWKAYYEQNKVAIHKKTRAWEKANPIKLKAQRKRSSRKHSVKNVLRVKEWRKAHPNARKEEYLRRKERLKAPKGST